MLKLLLEHEVAHSSAMALLPNLLGICRKHQLNKVKRIWLALIRLQEWCFSIRSQKVFLASTKHLNFNKKAQKGVIYWHWKHKKVNLNPHNLSSTKIKSLITLLELLARRFLLTNQITFLSVWLKSHNRISLNRQETRTGLKNY
jgi:hypothetical protein